MTQLPTRQQIRDYIDHAHQQGGKAAVTRREIARAFRVKGEMRTALRQLLKEMDDDGELSFRGGSKKMTAKGALPPVAVLDVLKADEDGDLVCHPPNWKESFAPPLIVMASADASKTIPPLGLGDRFLGRLSVQNDGTYLTKPIKAIGQGADRILGVFRSRKVGGAVAPVSRKEKRDLVIERGDEFGATDGDLVWAETKPTKGYGPKFGRIREVMGKIDDPSAYSLIALAAHDIPVDFPESVLAEADAAKLPKLGDREDLRDLPLITIDPADAKDHDDAVYACADDDPANKGGWKVIVAIADVSYFVPFGGALDREALKRGNSTYLPDQVVPMLPERLSNDLCSLKEGLERPCLAVEMIFAEDGRKLSHRFLRGLMKSHAGLSYEEAQAGAEGRPNDRTEPFMDHVITPLWGAYKAVQVARAKRSPMELEMPERKIVFNEKGLVANVVLRERFDAHKLIEEFMILANVCAAETLEQAKLTLIYRAHGEPDPEKLEGVRDFVETLGYSLPKGQVLRPSNFNEIIKLAREKDEVEMVSQVLLRSQRQAVYDTENVGHFGLNLRRYAHFTSPIRRYADLTVHRALVRACKLGSDGQTDLEAADLQKTAEDISDLERRSMSAERESTDRFLAAHLSSHVGATFEARISGVTRHGLFVTLKETGADGFIPMRSIGHEYFQHIEGSHMLVGERSKGVYRLSQPVQVKLLEVTPLQGGLLFELLSEPLEGITIPKSHKQNKDNRPGRSRRFSDRKPTGKKPKSTPGKLKPKKAKKPKKSLKTKPRRPHVKK